MGYTYHKNSENSCKIKRHGTKINEEEGWTTVLFTKVDSNAIQEEKIEEVKSEPTSKFYTLKLFCR